MLILVYDTEGGRMRAYEAYKLRDVLQLVRDGKPVPPKLLRLCEDAIAREIAIKVAAGRRTAEFFNARQAAESNDCAFDGKGFAARQKREAEIAAERPSSAEVIYGDLAWAQSALREAIEPEDGESGAADTPVNTLKPHGMTGALRRI